MSTREIAILGTGLLMVAMFANAASRNNTTRITVLDSETRSVSVDDSGVSNKSLSTRIAVPPGPRK